MISVPFLYSIQNTASKIETSEGDNMLNRRTLLIGLAHTLIGGVAFTASLSAAASDYPTRPVTIVVPFGAGGFTDNVGRLIAAGLSEKWKSPVVVENKPGAGGNIGAAYSAKQSADGYTLYLSNTATDVINPHIYKSLSYDAAKDFEPVILVVKTPNVLAVTPSLPVKNVKELIEYAKSTPGGLTFGTPGNGTTGHFTGMLFSSTVGVKLTHVPYKATPQVQNDVIAGITQMAFDNATSWAPHVNAGKVRALAVTSPSRSPLMPDVPTLQELGLKGFEATTFAGISVPKGTPDAIVQKLNRDIKEIIQTTQFKARMSGGEIGGGSSASFKEYIAAESQKWGTVAKQIGLRVE
jgi:tripartite-type tricarboxylate transporter receptor subunit TctC